MEKDDELKGIGNSYDFGARMLDPRVGRWFKTDYINKSWLSPYQFASNNPINKIDPDGNDEIHFYYYLTRVLDKEGKSHYQLNLSTEIIKNNSEHTYFMHNTQYNKTTQFYPFKSDTTPNQNSYSASKAELPMSSGISWLFFESPLDDYSYLGRILQAAPEVSEHYKSSGDKRTSFKFSHAINMADEVEFSQFLINTTETVYAIVDGYYLVKGLSKFVVKDIAKTTLKIGTQNIDSYITTSKVTTETAELLGKYERHIFSEKHIKRGVMNLGKDKPEILENIGRVIESKKSSLKEGQNYILTKINGHDATIGVNVKDGAMRSIDAYTGAVKIRDASKVNVIK